MTDQNEFANQFRRMGHDEYRREVEQQFAPRDDQLFFAPYVPLTTTPVVLDLEEFRPSRTIMERYSRERLLEGAANYSRISVNNWWDENVGRQQWMAPAAMNPRWIRRTVALGPPEKVNWLREGF